MTQHDYAACQYLYAQGVIFGTILVYNNNVLISPELDLIYILLMARKQNIYIYKLYCPPNLVSYI